MSYLQILWYFSFSLSLPHLQIWHSLLLPIPIYKCGMIYYSIYKFVIPTSFVNIVRFVVGTICYSLIYKFVILPFTNMARFVIRLQIWCRFSFTPNLQIWHGSLFML